MIGKKLTLSGVINEDFLWAVTRKTGVPPNDPLMTEELVRKTLLEGSSQTGLTTIEFQEVHPMDTEAEHKLVNLELVELMESLSPTHELMKQAVETISDDNHDATDTAMVQAIARIINTQTGLGSPAGPIWDWVEGSFGVGMANAVGFATRISKLEESDPEGLKRLTDKLTEAAFSQAPAKLKETMKEGIQVLGPTKAILLLWGLYNEGLKQGYFMGWRSHELALLSAITPKEE
jgi:hypothetical protein